MCDANVRADIQAYVQEVWEDVERDIDALVRIESVEDLTHAQEGAPFGREPRRALDVALGIARKLGLEPHDCDGYVGYADVQGEQEGYIATIAHCDIVPVGTGWHFDPLRLSHRDGYLVGRGVLDDKGPLVLSLYAAGFVARYARRAGVRLPHTLRCIIGTNEETGMRDIAYYLSRYPQPLFCFTPDASFPVICGEKGRLFVELRSPSLDAERGCVVRLEGGTAGNAIAGSASAVIVGTRAQIGRVEDIDVEDAGTDAWGRGLLRLVAHGKGGHAAMPEGSRSAVGMLVELLLERGICVGKERGFLELCRLAFKDNDGMALGIDATDELFEPLTCVGTVALTRQQEGMRHLVQCLDIRYPPSTHADAMIARLREVANGWGCDVECKDDMVPFLTSPDSHEVRILLETYREVFGRDGEAFTIGGGTYARHFQKAVAFGPADERVDDPSWVGPEHGPDEAIGIAQLQRALEAYALALVRLMGL